MEGIFYVKAAAFLGAAFTMAIGSIGPAVGQGLIGMKACESMGKYPESSEKVRNAMIISMSLVETEAIYALLIAGFLAYVGYSIT